MKQRQPAESIPMTCAGYIRMILNIIVSGYMLLVVMIMPFYYQEGYNHIGSDKSYFFRTYTMKTAKLFIPVLAAYLLCLAADQLIRIRMGKKMSSWRISVTDYFAVGFVVSVVISYLCSNYKETALWGSLGWYMGMIPRLMLIGIYFAVSRFWNWKKKEWMVYVILAVSAVVFALGIVNRFDWYPLPMENSGIPDFISTIGNINWYCGYVMCVLFLGVGMFWLTPKGKTLQSGLLTIYLMIGFATLVTQGSESGMFSLALMMVVLFILSAQDGPQRMTRFWQIMLILSVACLILFGVRKALPERMNYTSVLGDWMTYSALPFLLVMLAVAMLLILHFDQNHATDGWFRMLAQFACVAAPAAIILYVILVIWNTSHPGVLGRWSELSMFVFRPEWGSNRGATWSAGVRCFMEQDLSHKLTGIGPDCMWDYISQDGSKELLLMVEQVFGVGNRLTNAHCEWLTILADTGILGFVSYAGLMISAILRCLGRRKDNGLSAMCGLCLLAYTANNIWSFQQSLSVATIFVLLGMGEAE